MYSILQKIINILYRVFYQPIIRSGFKKCGKKVTVGRKFNANKISNISVGDYSSIGGGTLFLCTRAEIQIGSYVMFGPNVTIITGNHRTDIKGKRMIEVKDNEKNQKMICLLSLMMMYGLLQMLQF